MAIQKIRRTAFRLHHGHSYSCSIEAVGNTPLNHTYLQSAGEYDFDRTVVPVTVTPSITCDGADLDLTVLSAKAWYEVAADGSEVQITSSTAGFLLYPAGYPCGIQIKKNGEVKLVFRGKHDRTTITASVTARELTAAEPVLELELDAPSAQTWNPFTANDELTVTPRAHRGGTTVPATFKWQRLRDGVWTDIKPYLIDDATTEPLDCDVCVDTNTGTLTIDRRFMGDSAYLRCSATHSGEVRTAELSITRRIPDVEADTIMSSFLPDEGQTLRADAYIRYRGGDRIPNPSAEFLISWFVNGATTASGYGNSFNARSSGDSMSIEMGVEDRGALKALTDFDGAVFTDFDGKILFG